MYLRLVDGRIDLLDPENFRAFKLVLTESVTLEEARRSFGPRAEIVDDQTAWIAEETLRTWPGREQDLAWQEKLSAMIEKARPHGWVHPETGAIRAHIERQPLSAFCDDLRFGLKFAMRRLASTVTIITTIDGDEPHGMTATAVMSLSADPPSLAAAINRSASLHDPLLRSGLFCVNLLKPRHQPLCHSFSGQKAGAQRFEDGDWSWSQSEPPHLVDAQASIFCVLDGQFSYGTHTMIVGRISRVTCQDHVEPLLHQNAGFGRFTSLESS